MEPTDKRQDTTDWSKRPAANPRYEGRTPEEVVRRVLRPMSQKEMRELKSRCRKKA